MISDRGPHFAAGLIKESNEMLEIEKKCHNILKSLYLILILFYFSFISWTLKRHVTVVTQHDIIGLKSRRRAERVISRYISIVCLSHGRCIDIGVGLFIISMYHIY